MLDKIKILNQNHSQLQSWNTLHHPATSLKIEINNPSNLSFSLWRSVERGWDALPVDFMEISWEQESFKSLLFHSRAVCALTSHYRKQGTRFHQRTEGSSPQNKSRQERAVPVREAFLTKNSSFVYCFSIKTAFFFSVWSVINVLVQTVVIFSFLFSFS